MYEITITKTATETRLSGKEWGIIGKRLVTDEDIKPSAYESYSVLRDKVLAGNVILMEQLGYTPEIEKQVEVKREIFKQIVEDLNLVAVINAINGSH
jgi:hypothetical protein